MQALTILFYLLYYSTSGLEKINKVVYQWVRRVGLCESSFLLFEYSIEYFIEYSSTRWIAEVAINHRVVQNKRILGSSFKFVV